MKRWRWFAACAAALAMAGCADLAGDGYEYSEILVTVVDVQGLPIAGTQVEVYTNRQLLARALSDLEGKVLFDYVPFGNIGVRTFPPSGFTPAAGRTYFIDGLRVRAGTRADLEFVFTRACCGVARIRVQDAATGAGIPGAAVTLYGIFARTVDARTGADGTAEFSGLFEGSYGVRVEPPAGYSLVPGRSPVTDGIPVAPGSDTTVVFPLVRGGA